MARLLLYTSDFIILSLSRFSKFDLYLAKLILQIFDIHLYIYMFYIHYECKTLITITENIM